MATTHTDTGRLRRIEGRHNALVKELRQAFDRGELTPAGECAVEGFRIIEEAVRSGLRFRAIFFSELAQARTSRLLPQIGWITPNWSELGVLAQAPVTSLAQAEAASAALAQTAVDVESLPLPYALPD